MVPTGCMLMSGMIEIKWKQKFRAQDGQENLFVSSTPHTRPAQRIDSLHLSKSEVWKQKPDHVVSYLEPSWGFQEKLLVIIYMLLYCLSHFFSLILQQTSLLYLSFIPTAMCLFPPICCNLLYHRTIAHAVPSAWNMFLTYFEQLIPIYPLDDNSSNLTSERCPCPPWPAPLPKSFAPLFQYTCYSCNLICGITCLSSPPLFAKLYSTGTSDFDWEFHPQGLV